MRQVKLYLVMVRYLPMLRMAMATLEPVVHTSQHFLYRDRGVLEINLCRVGALKHGTDR